MAEKGFLTALPIGLVASLALLFSGHSQGQAVAKNQPPKLAAFEGHFHTGPASLYLFGWPDVEEGRVRYGLAVPGGLSLVIHGDPSVVVPGLDSVPIEDRPPVVIPFLTYHVMVVLGFAFIGLTVLAALLHWRRKLFTQAWLMWTFVFAVFGPYIANQAGWVATEVGRQPWVVYGLLRTKDAVSRTVPGEHIVGSIVLFSVAYAALFALWLFVLNEKVKHGPE